ncbi:uncharacterized protein LOC134242626 [Saccostrea cucullata]|uniref:uncharacterized protein LOC134242626 n=1 Tax=Saccostrea cuccullata TaxID=36930 RepID=UPI002ED45181
MFRFSMKDDIELLKEVSSVNPFSGDSVNKWAEIAENFMMAHEGVALDGRRCRERTSLLLSYFKADDRDKLYRSGTDEEYGEKEQLLQEVLELSEQVKFKTEKGKDESQKAQLIRKRAIENMKTATSDENDDSQCSVKRRKSNTMIDFLTHKTESENKLNQEKIELEKKKLELDEKK